MMRLKISIKFGICHARMVSDKGGKIRMENNVAISTGCQINFKFL